MGMGEDAYNEWLCATAGIENYQPRGTKMSKEMKFVDGLIVKAPNEKAPDFVKMAISIKRHELIEWLTAQDGDWINVDVKESKGGKWYCAVNDFKPEQSSHQEAKSNGYQPQSKTPAQEMDDFSDGIPFKQPHDDIFG